MGEVKLHYWLSNNGDGSASLRIEKTAKGAKKADDTAQKYDGFAESTADHVRLRVDDGKVYVYTYDWKKEGDERNVWVELKP